MNAPGAPLGILLVEDSPADSRLLVESLRGHVDAGALMIQTVRRLSDALCEIKRMRFSCVLVDLGLPDGEGVSNVARIREADPDVAVLVLTGLADQRAAEEAFALGAQDYLVKGQRLGDELLAFVRRAIEKRGPPEPSPVEPLQVPRYQPWVDVGRGCFAGVHVDLGSELANLSAALAALHSWREPGLEDILLAMSVPGGWLPRMAGQLAASATEAGARPGSVALRLDGAGLCAEMSVIDDLRRLRASGIRIWLEGWRPGLDSLESLARLPLDGVVIHAGVTDAIGRQDGDVALRFVRATLALGGALGLDVIADGVAQAGQQSRLSMIGCRHMQGPWFAPAEPAETLAAQWRQGPLGLERRWEVQVP